MFRGFRSSGRPVATAAGGACPRRLPVRLTQPAGSVFQEFPRRSRIAVRSTMYVLVVAVVVAAVARAPDGVPAQPAKVNWQQSIQICGSRLTDLMITICKTNPYDPETTGMHARLLPVVGAALAPSTSRRRSPVHTCFSFFSSYHLYQSKIVCRRIAGE